MKKRIFISMLMLTGFCLLISTVVYCMVFYARLSSAVRSDVRERALMMQKMAVGNDYSALSISDMRLTVIARDGSVLYDDDQNAAKLSNHADREEVREASATGVGESRRFSDTLGQETYYYAVKLSDGSVLRVAKSMSSIWGMFGGVLPAIFCVVLVLGVASYLLAGGLTRRIVEPINRVNLSEGLSAPYDELAPFVKAIATQREMINQQLGALRERAETIEAIMDNMGEGIVMVNRQGSVLSVNKSAQAFFELPSLAEGKGFAELFRDVEMLEALRGAQQGIRSEMYLEQNGKTFSVHFSPVAEIGVIILFMDISARAQAEVLRREFSANVSHELKTPLTTIYGNAEMLACGMVQEEDKQGCYDKIREEAGRMIALIEDILLLSKLDESSQRELLEEVDLYEIARESMEALAQKSEEHRVSFQLSGGGATLQANRAQMRELFYNLFDNAIKYNKPGGSVTVKISGGGGESESVISVADTGVGIPKEAQDRVFERFFRVDKSHSSKSGGTGLGLAIVKHVVRTHGGRIELSSKVGEGTEFRIFFGAGR